MHGGREETEFDLGRRGCVKNAYGVGDRNAKVIVTKSQVISSYIESPGRYQFR